MAWLRCHALLMLSIKSYNLPINTRKWDWKISDILRWLSLPLYWPTIQPCRKSETSNTPLVRGMMQSLYIAAEIEKLGINNSWNKLDSF